MRFVRFVVRLFAVFGFIVFLGGVAAGVWVWERMQSRPGLPEAVVLELDLTRPLADHRPNDPFAALFGHETTVEQVVDALERARSDPRVKGVLARFGPAPITQLQADEIRAAVARFRASGRFATAHADSFGELDDGMPAYLLAAAFEEVWLQPGGLVGVTGLWSSTPFLKGAFDRLGVRPEMGHREAYKTFANTFTETGFTPEHREMMESLVGDLMDQMVAGIAAGRGLAPDAVRAAVDAAPLGDRAAVDRRLVDRLAYRDEAEAAARARGGAGAVFVDVVRYLNAAGPPNAEGPVIALVHATGPIQRGPADRQGFLDERTIAADDLAEDIADAAGDPAVRAIVLRIDSPGGSAVGSETVRRALVRARAAGKPVVVSMGATAASGGYWIALGADRIVAQPSTLTASIGVVAGKLSAAELSERLGIGWGVVGVGANAGMFSPVAPFDETGLATRDRFLDETYRAFLARVAEGRNLPLPAVEAVAGGRVWTGRQAQERGLVDEIGGLTDALETTRRILGLASGSAVTLRSWPAPTSPFDRVLDLVQVRAPTIGLEALPPEIRALLRATVAARREEAVRMPELGIMGR
jgi:protease-4